MVLWRIMVPVVYALFLVGTLIDPTWLGVSACAPGGLGWCVTPVEQVAFASLFLSPVLGSSVAVVVNMLLLFALGWAIDTLGGRAPRSGPARTKDDPALAHLLDDLARRRRQ